MVTLSAERVRELFSYDPDTGIMTRLVRLAARTNVGDVVGTPKLYGGTHWYLDTHFDGHTHRLHRVIWTWMTGDQPPRRIDHKDCDGINNRWNNLRPATPSQNVANSRLSRANTTGLKGVTKITRRHSIKWGAQIKNKKLGIYDCPAAAHFSYLIAADKEFGEFARAR